MYLLRNIFNKTAIHEMFADITSDGRKFLDQWSICSHLPNAIESMALP